MEPKWLIDIMKKVMEVQKSNPELKYTDIEILKNTGVTTAELLFKLWKNDHHGNYVHFRLICQLMRAHGLMQAIKPSDSALTGSNTEYLHCTKDGIFNSLHAKSRKADFV